MSVCMLDYYVGCVTRSISLNYDWPIFTIKCFTFIINTPQRKNSIDMEGD